MAATKIVIANKALSMLGARKITSFTQSGSNEALAVNEVYDDVLDEVLSEHPWTFAQKRVELDYTVPDDTSRTIDDSVYTPVTITGATKANPGVITAASHGLEDDDWVYITGVVGMTELNGNFYIVDDATTNTFSLNDTDGDNVNTSAYTTYVSGGQIQKAFDLVVVDSGTGFVYNLPSDYIKIIKKSDPDANVKIEQDKIISDIAGLKIIYTFRNTDTTQYYPKFVQALATRLAAEIAFRISNSVSKASDLMKLYAETVLPMAVASDSTQGTPDEPRQDEWLNAQIFGNGRYATTGETWHPI